MILYIMRANDGDVRKIAVIDSASSVIWVRRYDTAGEFEIETPASAELWRILTSFLGELFVEREDSDIPMYIERIRMTEGVEGDTILISGRTADAVLDSRVIGYPTTIDDIPYAGAIRQLVNENLINPPRHTDYSQDPETRILRPFAFAGSAFTGANITRNYCGENLLEAVDGLLSEAGFGLQCRYVGGAFTFELLQGQDRPNVVFSHDNENLLSCEYDIDLREKCNVVFVNATGPDSETQADGSNPYTLVRQAVVLGAINYKRREGSMSVNGVPTEESTTIDLMQGYSWEQGSYLFADGAETSSPYVIRSPNYIPCSKKISVTATLNGSPSTRFAVHFYDANRNHLSAVAASAGATVTLPASTSYVRLTLSRSSDGISINPDDLSAAEAVTVSARSVIEYKADVTALGVPYQTKARQLLNVETVDNGLFRPYVDYFLGDTVHIITAHGVSGSAKVQEITEVEDAEGYRIYPTFSEWEIDS